MTWSKINFNQAPTLSPYSYGRECDGCDPLAPPGAGDHRDHRDQPHDAAGDSLCSSRSRCGENPVHVAVEILKLIKGELYF